MLKELLIHRGWLTKQRMLHEDSPPRPTEDRRRDYAEALEALRLRPTLH
ncbi:MAG: hypothetical protein PVI23_07985 [Maricaulaceae bacterium]|jgi:hypothetical protein